MNVAQSTDSKLPLWKCHKEVKGAKISRVVWLPVTSGMMVGTSYHPDAIVLELHFETAGLEPIQVPYSYIENRAPTASGPLTDGYYLEDSAGKRSWMSAQDFEAIYTCISEL